MLRAGAARLAMVVASLLVFLLLAEIATRFVGYVKDVDFTLYMRELTNSDRQLKRLVIGHPTLRWSLNPDEQDLATTSDFSVHYKINSKGLRDREYPYQKPPDKIRIVALGDSLTFGEGIPYGERFTDIAEQSFRNVELLTMGVPGYGLDQMVLMFAEEGVKYQPDVVMVVVARPLAQRHYLGTDWLDTAAIDGIVANSTTDAALNQTVYREKHDDRLKPRKNFLLRRSWFLSYLDYNITLWRLRPRMARADLIFWGVPKHSDTVAITVASNPEIRKLDAYLRLGLQRLASVATKREFQIVVVNIDPNWSPVIDLTELPPRTAVLDFSPSLRAAAAKHSLRFKYDPHYNSATNRLLGDLLANALKTHVPRLENAHGLMSRGGTTHVRMKFLLDASILQ